MWEFNLALPIIFEVKFANYDRTMWAKKRKQTLDFYEIKNAIKKLQNHNEMSIVQGTRYCKCWLNIILCSDRHFYWVNNIRLFEYIILTVQTHNIRNIFLKAGQQNSLVVSITLFLFWSWQLVLKKVRKKWKTIQRWNRSYIPKVEIAFNITVVSLRRVRRKKNLIILEIIHK